MTEIYKQPSEILSDFFRRNVVFPDSSVDTTDKTQTYNVTTTRTVLDISDITDRVFSIQSVTKNGTELNRFTEYVAQIPLEEVLFSDALVDGDEVVVEYRVFDRGRPWVMQNLSPEEISKRDYPVATVKRIGGGQARQGNVDSPMLATELMQVDVNVKQDNEFTVQGRGLSNDRAAEGLAQLMVNAIQSDTRDLFPALKNASIEQGITDSGYDTETQAYVKTFTIRIQGENTGRINL